MVQKSIRRTGFDQWKPRRPDSVSAVDRDAEKLCAGGSLFRLRPCCAIAEETFLRSGPGWVAADLHSIDWTSWAIGGSPHWERYYGLRRGHLIAGLFTHQDDTHARMFYTNGPGTKPLHIPNVGREPGMGPRKLPDDSSLGNGDSDLSAAARSLDGLLW